MAMIIVLHFFFFFFNDTATTEIYTLSLHDALPILPTRNLPKTLRRLAREMWARRASLERPVRTLCVMISNCTVLIPANFGTPQNEPLLSSCQKVSCLRCCRRPEKETPRSPQKTRDTNSTAI